METYSLPHSINNPDHSLKLSDERYLLHNPCPSYRHMFYFRVELQKSFAYPLHQSKLLVVKENDFVRTQDEPLLLNVMFSLALTHLFPLIYRPMDQLR